MTETENDMDCLLWNVAVVQITACTALIKIKRLE